MDVKTIFAALQREHPKRFADGQLRTLQRKVKHWRAAERPAQEVNFSQEHRAGELCESDFTHLTELGVSIAGEEFPHLLYHFVLTYSNWETGTIGYSESFAGLSEGLQQALFLKQLFEQLNSGRKERLAEEMEVLRALPERRFDSAKQVRVRVSSGSLINVERNSYSVNQPADWRDCRGTDLRESPGDLVRRPETGAVAAVTRAHQLPRRLPPHH
jgi:hypothetical protein